MELTRFLLIRHAQTELNAQLRYQGISDGELTEWGIWQAERLARRLKDNSLAAIYSSTLKRARQTAEIIASPHRIEVIALSELNELNFGKWEGLTSEEIEKKYPEAFQEWLKGNPEAEIPGGESRIIFKQRIEKVIGRLLTQHSGQTIALITHGGPIKTIISKILGENPDLFWKIRQDNASLNIIEFHSDHPVICLLNDTCHYQGID